MNDVTAAILEAAENWYHAKQAASNPGDPPWADEEQILFAAIRRRLLPRGDLVLPPGVGIVAESSTGEGPLAPPVTNRFCRLN